MKGTIHSMQLDLSDSNDSDLLLLSNSPSLSCKRYARMTAYGNHWRVEDDYARSFTNYDSGVACLEANEQSAGTGKDYVGVLTDIFLIDYGDMKTPVIIFSCVWKKRHDNFRNETYVRDQDGFLVVNFRFNTPKSVDPYVFPSQCSQVFFADDDLHPPGSNWKVILRKEARSRRKVEEDDDVYIVTNVASAGVVPISAFVNPPSEPDLVGAIILNDADNALALQSLDKPKKRTPSKSGKKSTGTGGEKRKKRRT
ncbi:hypothetical protein KC19_1G266500 [Ceratodon purpureus]|uniref:DUF4216 domain-containing protein n=1 Tax=Ceratodon purpureus TaxID=3225 RepID=A0A8T0JA33_CERPU|nr:hypothetical protein KC19_1G266500 [Ceratodon purpureus]